MGETSGIASVIQGSVVTLVDTPSFKTCSSGPHPVHKQNVKVKYADDSYLLIGSSNLQTAANEFKNIVTWADKNNLCLNRSKTKEMIIQRKSTASSKKQSDNHPGCVHGIHAMCILGVIICYDLKMDQHITRVLSTASSTLFALGTLRSKGLPTTTLHQIERATTLNSIMCMLHLRGGDTATPRTETESRLYSAE